jgi:hypothetical protein
MATTPNAKPFPGDHTGGTPANVAALDTLEANKRNAATGADPAAKKMLADLQRGKARAATLENVDDGRISDQPIGRRGSGDSAA